MPVNPVMPNFGRSSRSSALPKEVETFRSELFENFSESVDSLQPVSLTLTVERTDTNYIFYLAAYKDGRSVLDEAGNIEKLLPTKGENNGYFKNWVAKIDPNESTPERAVIILTQK